MFPTGIEPAPPVSETAWLRVQKSIHVYFELKKRDVCLLRDSNVDEKSSTLLSNKTRLYLHEKPDSTTLPDLVPL